MAKKMDEIHEELRFITPLIQKVEIQRQSIGANGQLIQGEVTTQAVWMLISSDRSYAFQLTQDQLLLISNKYTRYKDFEKLLDKGLSALLNHMGFIDITVAGVRYVDKIKKGDNEKFSDYISERLLPAEFSGLSRIGGVMMGTYDVGDSSLNIRCTTQPLALSTPEDLISTLAMTQVPGTPFKVELLDGNEMILDMDATNSSTEPKRIEEKDALLKQLDSLHTVANSFFRHKDVCTEYAFNVWKGEE